MDITRDTCTILEYNTPRSLGPETNFQANSQVKDSRTNVNQKERRMHIGETDAI